MNAIEAFVYKRVKNNYIIKNLLRNIYQGVYDLLPDYDSWFATAPVVREGFFFGFHDTTPFCADGRMSLANRLTIPLRMPTADDRLEVGVLCGDDFSEWRKIGETTAWNYHKGCRLQWVDAGRCIYNVCVDGVLRSRISDVGAEKTSELDWPIDTVSPDGRWATTFSYGRLQRNMPGYGYAVGDADAHLDENVTPDTGLYLIDIAANRRETLVTLAELARLQPDEGMADGTMHFVTHTEFSPDGHYISFLHRWYRGTFRRTRLVVYDRETRQMHVSPTNGMVSHYAWNRCNGIVAYCRMEGVDSHVYFYGPDMKEWKRCGYPQLNSDGHQHFIDDGTFVTDTYPDKRRHVRLYRVGVDDDKVELIADVKSGKRFVSPDEQHHWKCDLHPRVSPDGTMVSFDSVHTGERALCVMSLKEDGKAVQR